MIQKILVDEKLSTIKLAKWAEEGGFWAKGKLANKVVSAMSSAENPYGVSVTAGSDGMQDDVVAAEKYQAKRIVQIAGWIKKGSK